MNTNSDIPVQGAESLKLAAVQAELERVQEKLFIWRWGVVIGVMGHLTLQVVGI